MQSGQSRRFQLLMDLGRQVLFAVDGIMVRLRFLTRSREEKNLPAANSGIAVQLRSADRALAGWFVAPEGRAIASVLLFHGIGDRLLYWRGAQQRLARSGVSSLIFHYSGYADSEGATTPENLACDAHAAYAWLLQRVAAPTPVFVLGFSMGSGLAGEVVQSLVPQPCGLILCEAFTTLRLAAMRVARPASALGRLLPDIWKTVAKIGHIRVPILIVHTTGDRLFPAAMAQQLHAAAVAGGAEAELKILVGYSHSAPYKTVPEDYWSSIIDFITRRSRPRPG